LTERANRSTGRSGAALHRKTCVYCGGHADTKDHVPPRSFLNRPYPGGRGLITVPACTGCNSRLQRQQEYFLAILAQISNSPTIRDRVEDGGSIDRMLMKSPGLDARIVGQLRVAADGRVEIEPQHDRLAVVVRALTVGLFFHRFGHVPAEASLRIVALGPEHLTLGILAPDLYSERFRAKPWRRLQQGVFEYTFVRRSISRSLMCVMRLHQTLLAAVECPNPTRRVVLSKGHRDARPRTAGPWRGV
jgi:hypothetical protein